QANGEAVTTRARLRGGAAWLCLTWAGAALYGRAGTDQYTAIPVSSLQGAIFGLVAIAAILGSGLLPWRPWPAELWQRLRPRIAGPPIPLLYFAGFYFLVRMYQAGGGHYPIRAFNYVLVALGAACALGSALRAQAVGDRSAYFGEMLPMAGGFALIALGLGTPLGIAAAIATLGFTCLVAALLPLVADAELSVPVVLALLVSAGLPPGALFATRLLDLQAALEANELMGYLSLVGAGAWIIGMAAAARAVWLPAASESERPVASAAVVLGLFLGVGGVAVGVLHSAIAVPAAAAVIGFPATALTGLPFETETASGNWPAVALGGLLAFMVVGAGLARRRSVIPSQESAELNPVGAALTATEAELPHPHHPALLQPAWARLPPRLNAFKTRLTVPPEFRVTSWSGLDAAMDRGPVWLWLAILAFLSYQVLSR
ncbi:MAG: hypothetical protein M3010_10575, partial [Candidatus Dormibacteraeota bacterium]|nr:hypothetical protein [Candidatus Dormibacteraeota bacterium]